MTNSITDKLIIQHMLEERQLLIDIEKTFLKIREEYAVNKTLPDFVHSTFKSVGMRINKLDGYLTND